MANELQIVAQGDALTVYAVVRRVSDSHVWNGSAFVAWSDAAVADYDIALASVGGDLYAGDFPSGIPAGTHVRVNYYQRAGATPAITDLLLSSKEFGWTGSTLSVGGGAVAAAGCQLADLVAVKRYLEITDTAKDDLLQQLINQQSARVLKIIGRSLCAADYTEFYRSQGAERITLRQYPVIYVSRVAYGRSEAIRVGYTGAGIRAMVGVTDSGVRLSSTTSAGVTTNTTLEYAAYPTLSMMATAIDGQAGWDAEAMVDGLSNNLYRAAGMPLASNGADVSLTWPETDMGVTLVDQEHGVIAVMRGHDIWSDDDCERESRFARRGHVLVEYRAGYETIPQDVRQVVIELVSGALGRTGDKSASSPQKQRLSSESIGDYSYTLVDSEAEAQAERVSLAGEHISLLSPYMAHHVGGSW